MSLLESDAHQCLSCAQEGRPPGYNMSWSCFHSMMPIPGGCPDCKGADAPKVGFCRLCIVFSRLCSHRESAGAQRAPAQAQASSCASTAGA